MIYAANTLIEANITPRTPAQQWTGLSGTLPNSVLSDLPWLLGQEGHCHGTAA